MDFDEATAFDEEAATEGRWVDMHGAKFKIAMWNNRRHLAAQIRLRRERQRSNINAQALTEMDDIELTRDAAAEAVLRDWKGVTRKGEEIPYSVELARELFRRSPIIYNEILNFANELAEYKRAEQERDLGNLLGSSGTSLSSVPTGNGSSSSQKRVS